MGAGAWRLVRHPAAGPGAARPADPDARSGSRHRRRPADARAVRAAPGHLRRLHGQRPGARLHRGLHPRRGAPPLRQHPHREQRHRPADHPAARGRPRPDPPLGQRRRRHRGDLLRQRHHGAIDKLVGILGIRLPGRPRPPAPALGPDPARAAAGGLHRPLRAPQQRAALARVDRRRGDHPRGRRRPHRRRPAARAELERYADRELKIGSFSAASNVTGIVTDTHRITRLLHEHGALALWDFAAARRTSTSR